MMTSSPREKDAWMDALKKVLGDRFSEQLQIVVEVKKVASNLERSDSKRSEVKSAPILDGGADNSAFTRSYSAGPTFNKQGANRSAGSSPVPEKEIQQKVSSLMYLKSLVNQVLGFCFVNQNIYRTYQLKTIFLLTKTV